MSISSLWIEVKSWYCELFLKCRIRRSKRYFLHRHRRLSYVSWSAKCYSATTEVIFDCKNSSSEIFLSCKLIFYSCAIPVDETSDIGIADIFHELELFSLEIRHDDLMPRDKWCRNRIPEKCEHSRHPDRKYRHTDDQFDESESLFRDERLVGFEHALKRKLFAVVWSEKYVSNSPRFFRSSRVAYREYDSRCTWCECSCSVRWRYCVFELCYICESRSRKFCDDDFAFESEGFIEFFFTGASCREVHRDSSTSLWEIDLDRSMTLVIVEETISYRSVCEDPFLRDHIDGWLHLSAFHIVTIREETDR